VFPRRSQPADTRYGAEDSAGAATSSGANRRLTGALPRAAAEPPAVLRFPRGTATRFSIGRDASCDLAISDMTVSRVHARLERTEDGWLLTDLNSTNGTRVNGWRVRGQVQVHAGDLVSFGNAEYSLSAVDAS
jgi:predicted component of type VI protein secretion system